MGGKVVSAPAYQGSSLGSNSDISQKYNLDDIRKRVANTPVARHKDIHKNNVVDELELEQSTP